MISSQYDMFSGILVDSLVDSRNVRRYVTRNNPVSSFDYRRP